MKTNMDVAVDRHRSMQILLALFSILFVAVVAYGYYHLLTDFGWFIALVGGGLIAALAWFLARVAGTGEGGIASNWILIVPLFLISAAGVYNTMMVYLEGGQVLSDAAANSQQQFARVENAAKGQLDANGISKRVNKVTALRDALFSEINNPVNCGQGPEARRIIAELQRELPEFKPLSTRGDGCAQNEEVLEDYKTRLNGLIAKAAWNDPELNAIVNGAQEDRRKLSALQIEISRSYSPGDLHQVRSTLEEMQGDYQDLVLRLSKKADVSEFPSRLDIVGAQSLGNVYKLPALFFSRIGEISTYVYLLMAFGFDLLLVYLFQLATRNRVKGHAIDSAIAGAW